MLWRTTLRLPLSARWPASRIQRRVGLHRWLHLNKIHLDESLKSRVFVLPPDQRGNFIYSPRGRPMGVCKDKDQSAKQTFLYFLPPKYCRANFELPVEYQVVSRWQTLK